MLADKINDRGIAITAEIKEDYREFIMEELEQIKAKDVEKDAPLQIIPKDEVKEILNHSPDFSDTMVMRMYFVLDKKRKTIATTSRPQWRGHRRVG